MTDRIRLDSHKLFLHPKEVARWLQARGNWDGLRDLYPIYLEVCPFGGCNCRCSFCGLDFLNYRANRLETELLQKTLQDAARKGVKSILLAGEGEPLLHDELDRVIAHAAEAGLSAALVSNFAVKNPEALDSAVTYCRWIKVSLNAGTADVWRAVHGSAEKGFDLALENLSRCLRARERQGTECTIGVQAVLLDQNRDSMVDLARICRDLGADYLAIKPFSRHPASGKTPADTAEFSELKELAGRLEAERGERFQVEFRLDSFRRNRAGLRSYGKCHATPVFWAYVRSTGDVYGCLDFLHDPRFRYGNIREKAFEEIWEGEDRRKALEFMLQEHDPGGCRVNCRMNQVNEYLWELLHPSGHANFI